MKCAFSNSFILCLAFGTSLPAQQSGVPTQWDISKTLEAISVQANRLKPVLDQFQPQTWVSKGAPETYVTQWNASRTQAQALAAAAHDLSEAPDKLSSVLETYFRLQALEVMLGSLSEGIRKYQNPATADLLSGIVAENGANRERFKQYILELAVTKEQEFKVVDQEAQRCRENLSKQPVPIRRPEKKPERK